MARSFRPLALASLVAMAAPAGAATLTVINTNDAGPGSLRECVDVANASSGPHRIVFAIPGAGVQTIQLLSDLPDIVNKTAIDGTSQPGYNEVPLIEVNGTSASRFLDLAAPNSSVKGLILNRFQNYGLVVSAEGCTVSSCYVGLNASGTASAPNGEVGIYVTGDRALIGGHIPAFRNVISGNFQGGVTIVSPASQDSVVGNYIGTNATGTSAVSIAGPGVEVQGAHQVVIGGPREFDGNLISGNGYGIYAWSSTALLPGEGVEIYRNRIGTDAGGNVAVPNILSGIEIESAYAKVGGIGLGNVISGNLLTGIYLDGNYGAAHTQIQGNKIGVTSDGTRPLGNQESGIEVDNSPQNLIGGSLADGSGNLVCANGDWGISIGGVDATDNVIYGNAVGTTFNGALALGNNQVGIATDGRRTIIGGPGALGNVVAHNKQYNVRIYSELCPVRGNSIFASGNFLGLDNIDNDGGGTVVPNDSLDGDVGSNWQQNHPVLTALSRVGGDVRLEGRLSSHPDSTFTVDFYSNRQCNASGYGDGESWLGSTQVTTNASGFALFDVLFPLTSIVGNFFTCTATSPAGNSSEFSPCAPLAAQTAVDDPAALGFALGASVPSPARGTTSIPFSLGLGSSVTIRAYDVAGRRVATIFEGDLPAGPHRLDWAVDGVGAGKYFCRLEARAQDGSGRHFAASREVIVVR